MSRKIKITTGNGFDGYYVSEYKGFVSKEFTIGVYHSDLDLVKMNNHISDRTGQERKLYSIQIEKAKNGAIDNVRDQVCQLGGNALIGANLKLSSFGKEILAISFSGTAVVIEENAKENIVAIHRDTQGINTTSNIIVSSLKILKYKTSIGIYAEITCKPTYRVSAFRANIAFANIWGDEFIANNVEFFDFNKTGNDLYISSQTEIDVPAHMIHTIEPTSIDIINYINYGVNVDTSVNKDASLADNTAKFLKSDYLSKISTIEKSSEILTFTEEYLSKYDSLFFQDEMIELIKNAASTERMYGRNGASCVKKLIDFLDGVS